MFPWQQVQSNQANCTEWRTLYHVRNPQVCRDIGSRSQIGSIISQLKRRQNYATNFTRNGPSATDHSHTLLQHDGIRNCKRYYQETTFPIHGNEFFWVTDQVKSGVVDVQCHPGQENLADYTSKHHDSKHHQVVRQWYIQGENSPCVLPHAARPSALWGCVGTVSNGYNCMCPLPRMGVSLRHLDKVPCGRALVQSVPIYIVPE